MTAVVLQITDFFRYVFVNPGQILSYLNDYFAKNLDSMQYCEEIENGFLFVFRDIDAFTYRAKPLEPASLIQIEETQLEKGKFFQSFFVSQNDFPPEGIEIEIRVIEGEPPLIVPIAKKFVKSVNSQIIIHDIDERTINVQIPTYSTIQGYVNSLVRRFYLSTM
ncbi:MAG: hypothetical protein E4G98_03960 [Promethearchaeota archaeon]|nr:MAG: hypothetical protein E4G98_03960 [Candidatus Lokiarchaeota archaeon]